MSRAPTAAAAAPATEIPRIPDVDQARKAMVSEAAETHDPRVTPADPKAAELYDFDISVVDAGGKTWAGAYRNHILTIPERSEVGILAARLSMHTPFAALDPDTAWLLQVQAHLTLSLDERPRWFKLAGEGAIRNTRIISAVFAEVMAHEAYFRGREPNPGEGES